MIDRGDARAFAMGRKYWIAQRGGRTEMALSKLQSDILRLLAKNRSDSSYLAGGFDAQQGWERRSDDITFFHDTDEEVTESAKADWSFLDAAGFKTHRGLQSSMAVRCDHLARRRTTINPMVRGDAASVLSTRERRRLGSTAHQADLAIKRCGGGGRSKARDIADLVAIGRDYVRWGPLVLAAAGKPPISLRVDDRRDPASCTVDSG